MDERVGSRGSRRRGGSARPGAAGSVMSRPLWLLERDAGDAAAGMLGMIEELYPLCRSITGQGVRDTLAAVAARIPLERHEVPSGTTVFDWKVPPEWNIRDAYVAGPGGERVVDFRDSNLHVVSYSIPVHERLSLDELRPHLHTLPDHPDWIPYRTSYYRQDWGFCLRHRDLLALEEGEYEVVIDSTLKEDGGLDYGELYIPGRVRDEILISTHICHPAMCNDNLSGIACLTALAQRLAEADLRYSYRLLFIPATIGAITWLARNRGRVAGIRHGLVLAGVGDRGPATYKRSRRGDAEIDRAMIQALRETSPGHVVLDFSPYGYDERQFCSPGFNLPVGRFSRSEYATYPEYHTSADNLEFISPDALSRSLSTLMRVLEILEGNRRLENRLPHCEPQLGKRGLYDDFTGAADPAQVRLAILWVLNLSDGAHSLLDIAQRSGLPFDSILSASEALERAGLIESAS